MLQMPRIHGQVPDFSQLNLQEKLQPEALLNKTGASCEPFLMKEHEPDLSKSNVEEFLQLEELYKRAGAA
jgi:hypothetical protein